jgi:pathogenesis-related protein 1
MTYLFRPWLFLGTSVVAILVVLPIAPLAHATATIHPPEAKRIAQAPPFALDGKVVYVSRQGAWLEARISGYSWRSDTGYLYNITYITSGLTEKSVPVSRIITLAEAQKRGLVTKTYDLSTKAAVDEMLAAHNNVRKRYGIAPLTWSPQLATYAQAWANTLIKENRFAHRSNNVYGENIYFARGQQRGSTAIVQLWDDEVKNYTYATNTCRAGTVCGHYKQLVWRKTTQVGCGMAKAADREIWVCNYNPPGNFNGVKPY